MATGINALDIGDRKRVGDNERHGETNQLNAATWRHIVAKTWQHDSRRRRHGMAAAAAKQRKQPRNWRKIKAMARGVCNDGGAVQYGGYS